METVTDFIFLGSKIIADGDCSHEIKRCLLLGRKVMAKLDSVLKSRDITLLTKSDCSFQSNSHFIIKWASLVTQMVKNLPAMRET